MIQRQGTQQLGGQHGVEPGPVGLGDPPIPQHAGRVDHAMDRPEPPARLVEGGSQGGAGDHVRAEIQHVRALGLDRGQGALDFRRQGGAAQKDQAGLDCTGKVAGDGQPDRAGTAGDQAGLAWREGEHRQRIRSRPGFQHLCQAGSVPVGDRGAVLRRA